MSFRGSVFTSDVKVRFGSVLDLFSLNRNLNLYKLEVWFGHGSACASLGLVRFGSRFKQVHR